MIRDWLCVYVRSLSCIEISSHSETVQTLLRPKLAIYVRKRARRRGVRDDNSSSSLVVKVVVMVKTKRTLSEYVRESVFF